MRLSSADMNRPPSRKFQNSPNFLPWIFGNVGVKYSSHFSHRGALLNVGALKGDCLHDKRRYWYTKPTISAFLDKQKHKHVIIFFYFVSKSVNQIKRTGQIDQRQNAVVRIVFLSIQIFCFSLHPFFLCANICDKMTYN